MKIKQIQNSINGKNKVIFSPEPEAIHYIWFDKEKQIIGLTSDNQDYLMNDKLEYVIEEIYKKFGITKFEIIIHSHPGDMHDKDIEIKLKDNKKTAEIINFIIKNFYKNKEWRYN